MGLQLKRAFEIVLLTRGFILHRAAIYGGICACVIAFLGLLALIGMVFGAAAFWVLLTLSVGIAVVLAVGGFLAEFFFYWLKAGHIALIAGIMAEGKLPGGISQVKWARERVLERFGNFGPLTQMRGAIKTILRGINRTYFPYSAVYSLPAEGGGAQGTASARLTQRGMDLSQKYLEEAIVGYALRARDESLFPSVRTAIMLYCNCAKILLKNAMMLTLLGYAFFVVAAVAFLVPLGLVAMLVPHSWTMLRFVLFASGIFLGLSTKWAVFDPIACASTILTFFDETELAAPDSEWEQRVNAAAQELDALEKQGVHPAPDSAP